MPAAAAVHARTLLSLITLKLHTRRATSEFKLPIQFSCSCRNQVCEKVDMHARARYTYRAGVHVNSGARLRPWPAAVGSPARACVRTSFESLTRTLARGSNLLLNPRSSPAACTPSGWPWSRRRFAMPLRGRPTELKDRGTRRTGTTLTTSARIRRGECTDLEDGGAARPSYRPSATSLVAKQG